MSASQGRDSGTWVSHQLNADKPRKQAKKLGRTAFWRTWPLLWVIAAWAAIAFALFIAAGLLIWWLFVNDPQTPGSDLFVGENGADPLKFVQTILAIVGGVGAVGYLVIKYRERSDAESSKADQRLLEAVSQLGSDSPQVRIAGVYALADIADTFQGPYKQRVVDILCGYLRTDRSGGDVQQADTSTPNCFRDAAVESTVLSVIASHVHKDADFATSWSECDFDVHGAVFHEDIPYADTEWSGTLICAGTSFRGSSNFKGADFSDARLTFEGAKFSHKACFGAASFGKMAHFESALFGALANFERASFGYGASFDLTTFGLGANFSEASFGIGATFWRASFLGAANFERAAFVAVTVFNEASFGVRTVFSGASFGDGAVFSRASFGDGASFSGGSFGDGADFGEALFAGKAFFRGVSFGNGVLFRRVSFGGEAVFRRVSFGDRAVFGGALFAGKAFFSRASFGDRAVFSGASFGDRAVFSGASFGDWADFSWASFGAGVDFSGTRYGEGSVLTEIQQEWLRRELAEQQRDGRVEEDTAQEAKNDSTGSQPAASDDVAPAVEETSGETGAADEKSTDNN